MTKKPRICASISRIAISLLVLLLGHATAEAQGFLKFEKDSIPMFQGFTVSADLIGVLMMRLGDYGQYEGAVRLNLHDQYYPTVEVGYGKANHEDDIVTGITYKTQAPYFRVGCDFNLMKKKHTGNRIYTGLRYGFTSYKVDLSRMPFEDPYWKWQTNYGVDGESCHQHWIEVVFGLDAKVIGPVHFGWSVRYRRRVAHNDGIMDKTWYVPGFGIQGSTRLGGMFNIAVDI